MAKKPIDLKAERMKRDQAAGEAAHAQGEAFKLLPYDWDTDDVGLIDGDLPIVVMTGGDSLEGIAMTRDSARRLGEALIGAAAAELPGEESKG
ncbi:MAG TPA: hypothetical protein VM430_08250 [Microbacterium sp.]|jgi:hypothetical protein|nr:hypothetical protein [Microbacterium sp.]